MAHDRPKKGPPRTSPRTNRVAQRWRIEPSSPFFAAPEAYFRGLWDAGVTPYEERILTVCLMAWRWDEGGNTVARISCAEIARQMGTTDRGSVRRALKELGEKGVIGFDGGAIGARSTLDIQPLVKLVSDYSIGKRRGAVPSRLGCRTLQDEMPNLAGHLQGVVPLTCKVPASGMTTQIARVPEENAESPSAAPNGCASGDKREDDPTRAFFRNLIRAGTSAPERMETPR